MFRLRATVLGVCAVLCVSVASAAQAANLDLSIVIFGPPSLGAFLPPVIKASKLDEKNGLSINFVERTPDAYTAQFNSGEFQLGGSASLLTVGQADVRGVKVAYLFNLFDFWGAVVTSRPEVATLKDLEGKELAAARGTTNYLMFDWFARQQGVDPAKLSVVNTATPGLVGYALADRAAAVQLWEPAYTILLAKKPSSAHARSPDRRKMDRVRRQPQHSLSGRCGAYRLDREEPRRRSEALRDLQGGRRLDDRKPGRSRETHLAERLGRRPEIDSRT